VVRFRTLYKQESTNKGTGKGLEVLNWLISITSASFFINWAIVAFTSFRFRAAVKAQNAPIFSGSYSWKSPLWPLAPAGALVISTLLLICLLYSSIEPLVRFLDLLLFFRNTYTHATRPQGDTGFTAYNFFVNIIGILVIVVPTALYKIVLRTEWRDPAAADLVTGRRQLTPDEIILMDGHYSRPLWRRVGTYVKLW
jgi:amino acid transporter